MCDYFIIFLCLIAIVFTPLINTKNINSTKSVKVRKNIQNVIIVKNVKMEKSLKLMWLIRFELRVHEST